MDANYGRGSNNVLQMLPTQLKPLSFYATQIGASVKRLGEATAELKKEADRDTAATKLLNGRTGLHAAPAIRAAQARRGHCGVQGNSAEMAQRRRGVEGTGGIASTPGPTH